LDCEVGLDVFEQGALVAWVESSSYRGMAN